MLKNIAIVLLFSLIISSCNSKYYYINTTEYGEERIVMYEKKDSFKFERKTFNQTYSNHGKYIKTDREITFKFTDPILDARFLPHFKLNQEEPTISETEDDAIIIQPIDGDSKKPIQAQAVYLYSTTFELLGQYETDFDGCFNPDASLAGQKVIMYCAYWHPMELQIPASKGVKIKPVLKSIGTFDVVQEPQDVIVITGMKYKFQIEQDKNLIKKNSRDQIIKKFNRKKKSEL